MSRSESEPFVAGTDFYGESFSGACGGFGKKNKALKDRALNVSARRRRVEPQFTDGESAVLPFRRTPAKYRATIGPDQTLTPD
jgi:hypothetical protein